MTALTDLDPLVIRSSGLGRAFGSIWVIRDMDLGKLHTEAAIGLGRVASTDELFPDETA